MIRIIPISAILLFMFAGSYMASGIRKECCKKQEISCEGLWTFYRVPYNVVMHLTHDCEHGWYYPNGTFIADSTGGGKNLTMSTCLNIEWHVECPTSEEIVRNCTIIYSVSKPSKADNDSQTGNKTRSEDKPDHTEDPKAVLPPWAIVFIVIVILLVVVGGLLFVFWKCCLQRGKGSNDVL